MMTIHDVIQCIQGIVDCMNKCDVFDCNDTDECENCEYCYKQGTFGEQKEAFNIAINCLKRFIEYDPNFSMIKIVRVNNSIEEEDLLINSDLLTILDHIGLDNVFKIEPCTDLFDFFTIYCHSEVEPNGREE